MTLPSTLKTFLAKVGAALEGEPLRAIVYGAVAIVWLVTQVALALGYQGFGTVDLNAILIAVTAATVALSELVRQFVTPTAAPALNVGTVVTTPNGCPAAVKLTV
jgi:hypothetical protein